MERLQQRIGASSGVIFVAVVVGAGAISGFVDVEPTESANAALTEFRTNAGDIETGAWLTMIGLGFLLLFLAHLRTRLRAEGAGWAADGLLAGGIAVAVAMIAVNGALLTGTVAGETGHADVAQGAVDFLWNSSLLFSPGLLAAGIAAAVASFSHRLVPTWLGVLGMVVALGSIAPWIGIFVFFAWILAASIVETAGTLRRATVADVR